MKKEYFKIIKILISIFLMWLLFTFVDFENILHNISHAKLTYIIIFIFLTFISIIISSYKWYILASCQGFKKKPFFYFKTYFVGIFLNNFFPSFIGGDTYRIFALSSKKNKLVVASESVVIDRISGLITVIFLSAIFGNVLIIFEKTDMFMKLIVLFITVLGLGIFMFFYFLNSKLIQKILSILPKKVLSYIVSLKQNVFKKTLWQAMTYSIIFTFFGIVLSNYVLFLSLDTVINPISFLSVIFLISIISSMPVSIGNIGIKEWAYITMFGIFGVDSTISVTVVLLSRALQMGISLFAVPFYLSSKNKIDSK